MDKLILTIELIPKSSWYTNVRSNVTKKEWDLIRRKCYKLANYKCEICSGIGKNHPVECHEIWEYDDKNNIQKLVKFISLCPKCHQVKHIGLSQMKGLYEECIIHWCNINNIDSKDKAEEYIRKCFDKWLERSYEEWTINIDYIKEYLEIKSVENDIFNY